MRRQRYDLTDIEIQKRQRLPDYPGAAFSFWRNVARDRGLDPSSVIAYFNNFTALPAGHEAPWCAPLPIKCMYRYDAE